MIMKQRTLAGAAEVYSRARLCDRQGLTAWVAVRGSTEYRTVLSILGTEHTAHLLRTPNRAVVHSRES